MTVDRPGLSAEDLEMVRRVARGFRGLVPASVEPEELVSYGTLGMIEARQRFDPARGVPFRVFAHYRIRGAIYDGLRQLSWISPNAFKHLRAGERTDAYMETVADRAYAVPGRERAAALLGQVASDLSVVYLTTDAAPAWSDPTAEELSAEDRAQASRLREALETLPEQEREVMRRVYLEDASLAEAGAALGLSRSWACRLHAAALGRLRAAIGPASGSGDLPDARDGPAQRSSP